MNALRTIKKIGIIGGIVAIVLYFALNMFSYFDPISLCRIKIHADTLRGNRQTIKSAISLLKKSSPKDYKNLCAYVAVISEKFCFAGDPRVDPQFTNFDPQGCYVRGTHTIYLKPSQEISREMVQKRSALITTYAEMSRAFWTHSDK